MFCNNLAAAHNMPHRIQKSHGLYLLSWPTQETVVHFDVYSYVWDNIVLWAHRELSLALLWYLTNDDKSKS